MLKINLEKPSVVGFFVWNCLRRSCAQDLKDDISEHILRKTILQTLEMTPGYLPSNMAMDSSPFLDDCPIKTNTLLRVIPTLAFQVIYSDIYFDILPNILSGIYSDILSGISSSILSGIFFGVLSGIYFGILCGILSRIYIWHSMWHIFWQSIWHIFWQSFWHYIWPLRSSSAHPLGSEGPWLRSSGAHCAQNLAVEVQPCPLRSEAGSWGPAVTTARGSWRRDWRRVGKAEVDVEVEAEVVEEKEEDEEEVEEKEEPEQLW